jgi:glyoxylase-like metal-dependent hydrolase (beta-lactamase superfamily II)
VTTTAGIEKVVTSGTFALDGGEWQVENNVWLVGDDREVLVVDAAHDAEIALHPADRMLWAAEYGEDLHPDIDLGEADPFTVAGTALAVLHTPGHTPGSVCLYAPELGVVFSGDTLFQGGPGATGRSYSDFGEIIDSIRDRVLTLPPATVVHTGHGADTTIGRESPHLGEWMARGH